MHDNVNNTMPRSFGLREVILLSALVGAYGFTLPTRVFHPTSVSLRMGYLDNLSPQQEDEPKKQISSPPKKKPSGGGIPSGRGPLASYLDIMTGSNGASANDAASEKENSPPEEETPAVSTTPVKPAGWSGIYLNDFLDGNDDSRTDIRNLLTQRSIQSFMFLLEQCRDPHSAKWIQEDFLETGNLLDYHGTGAGFIERFGGTWDAALIAMTQQPKTQIIISAKRRGRGHGGWSKNNPYLKERWMEMPIDIDPPSLATRILSVREHIAREWTSDLDVVLTANNMILKSYFSKVRSDRDQANALGARQKAGGAMDVAFDRTAVNLMNDNSRFSPTESSPFRRGNFDLLYNLCTQAAIHRILRTYKGAGEDRSIPFLFLRGFYTERAAEYFDGDLQYGQADDFIDDLLRTSPAILSAPDGKTGLTDPLGAAESIIRMRNQVVNEWKETMERVQEDHSGVQSVLLSKQMQNWDTSSTDSSDDGFQ